MSDHNYPKAHAIAYITETLSICELMYAAKQRLYAVGWSAFCMIGQPVWNHREYWQAPEGRPHRPYLLFTTALYEEAEWEEAHS